MKTIQINNTLTTKPLDAVPGIMVIDVGYAGKGIIEFLKDNSSFESNHTGDDLNPFLACCESPATTLREEK